MVSNINILSVDGKNINNWGGGSSACEGRLSAAQGADPQGVRVQHREVGDALFTFVEGFYTARG